jgi:hypothetical protein
MKSVNDEVSPIAEFEEHDLKRFTLRPSQTSTDLAKYLRFLRRQRESLQNLRLIVVVGLQMAALWQNSANHAHKFTQDS